MKLELPSGRVIEVDDPPPPRPSTTLFGYEVVLRHPRGDIPLPMLIDGTYGEGHTPVEVDLPEVAKRTSEAWENQPPT